MNPPLIDLTPLRKALAMLNEAITRASAKRASAFAGDADVLCKRLEASLAA